MFDEHVAELDSRIEALLHADLSAGSGVEVMELVVELERVQRRIEAVGHRLVAEVQSRRLAGEYARTSTAELLVTALRVSPGEARARARQASDLGQRTTLTGQPLPPLLPVTSRATAAGEISGAHVEVITRCLDQVPPTLSADAVETVEALLVDAARHEHPGSLRRTAALLLARLDPDGPEPDDDRQQRDREVTLSRYSDGSGRLRGRLTPEATAVWDTVFDALSAPAPSEDGIRDDRTAGQRRHDALLDAGHRLLRSGSLPASGGVPVTVLIRTTATDLATAACADTHADADADTHADAARGGRGRGIALSARGDLLGLRDLLPALGDAEFIPVVLDEGGAVLSLGRTQRLATRAQRLALAARDGGCCFPGCDRPAAWAEVHHVREWRNGGPTDVDNMCLLCRFHHREFERRGWRVQMTDGTPQWIPPPFIDRDQRPRRNHTHHPPDLHFDLDRDREHSAA